MKVILRLMLILEENSDFEFLRKKMMIHFTSIQSKRTKVSLNPVKMTDHLHAIQRAIGYLMDIGGGSIQSSNFTVTLNLKQSIVIPAPVAEVPAPVAEVPAPVAVFPPLPPPEELPPLPPAPAEEHDVSTMARNLLANVLGDASIPRPAVGGAGIVPPVLNVRRPAIYDEMEKDLMASRSVSGTKRSFQEMSRGRINSDVIRETPEFKWMIAGFPTKVRDVYNIEFLNYKDESLFFLKKHRCNKCIYVGFRREAIDKIVMDFKLNESNLQNAFHVYLDMIVDNSSDDILKSIKCDAGLSSYYGIGVVMNGRIVQYSEHNLLIWNGCKRFRID
jgi:hypothetical protein